MACGFRALGAGMRRSRYETKTEGMVSGVQSQCKQAVDGNDGQHSITSGLCMHYSKCVSRMDVAAPLVHAQCDYMQCCFW